MGIGNKSWWVLTNRNSLDCFICEWKYAVYFDSFGVENIRKEIKKFIGYKNIIANIYRIKEYDSIMCRYFCLGSIDFMLKGKSLLDYTNLFSPDNYEKNYKIILKYFQ